MFNLGEISMKKTLVALAALAATGAFAQSSVTLYGIADINLNATKVTTSTGGLNVANAAATGQAGFGSTAPTAVTRNQMSSGGINGSRFGLRGSEDLGGGLKANFLFENGFNLDNGSAAQGGLLFGRQAFAGLSGNFGEVRFGRQYTAYDEARGGSDLQGHSVYSATAGAAWALGRDYTFRADNTWRYATPNMGGFSAAVSYSLGENKTATTGAGGVLALHGAYANGPIAIFVAHQQEKNDKLAPATALANGGFSIAATANKETHTLISGSYNFGPATGRIAYNTSKDDAVGAPSADKELTFGVSAPLGPVTLAAEYATMKNSGLKGRALGMQANYNLSKRTFAYVGLQNMKADTIVVAPLLATTSKSNVMAVGLRHAF
jgi:predicted porin